MELARKSSPSSAKKSKNYISLNSDLCLVPSSGHEWKSPSNSHIIAHRILSRPSAAALVQAPVISHLGNKRPYNSPF